MEVFFIRERYRGDWHLKDGHRKDLKKCSIRFLVNLNSVFQSNSGGVSVLLRKYTRKGSDT